MTRSLLSRSLMVLTCLAGGSFAFGQAPPKITTLNVYPPEINLQTKEDLQRYIVVATREDGVTLDVTGKAEAKLAADIAKQEGNILRPAADGQTTLNVSFEGLTCSAPVTVKDAAADRPVSFQLDVMPVFMRTGCNTGSCHGAARGKDGFRLSLFGFDPAGDYFRVTREIGVRRINLAQPKESLLLEKSIGAVPHTGGKRFDAGSEYYATVLKWLEAGVPNDAGTTPAVLGVDIYPPKAVLEGTNATQQFIARARYADGTDRDVTSLAVFITSNDASAPIDANGLVTSASRGEAFILARFETHTVGVQALVLPAGMNYTPPPVTGNYIDKLIADKLTKIRMLPSGLCSDEQFLRRTTIDIIGLLPTEEEYAAFMADQDPAKREKLVDRLLDRREFSELWAMKWAEVLKVKSTNQVSAKSIYLYHTWLSDQFLARRPFDEIVREMLTSSGGTFTAPQTNFYQVERDTLKTSENVAQVFMGLRTQCAQCHNHPFDRWTMNDYYGFAAFFSQIGRKQAEDEREQVVFNSGGGEVRHPVAGKNMPPQFLGGETPDVAGKDRREVLAGWLTSPENPFFAQNVANRIWAHYFGRGIIEPVDDIRVSNPPSNPELLAELAKKLKEYKFDFRKLVRDICLSETYQRTTGRNESNLEDEINFAHGNVRRIPAENLLDCIVQATDGKEKYQGLPLGARAVQIADGRASNYFLETFGRSPRETVCAGDATTDPSLSQALHLLNGQTVNGKIAQGGIVRVMLGEKKTQQEVIERIYVRCLSRKPTPEEMDTLVQIAAKGETPQAGLEDVFWAVLNSREFLFNH